MRKRASVMHTWPVMPGSETPPKSWSGWPGGKQFALVLTHDIEGQAGLTKCHQLMDIERRLGFRSSFNFVPEGEYSITQELRDELKSDGFEVGVHDLRHDGRLYRNRRDFAENARRINTYLKDWDAVGFRSAFMFHNLEWLHDLNVRYDSSTFDTDPFEPQPHPRNTIFPFWVPRPDSPDSALSNGHSTLSHQPSALNGPGSGYVELPYTVPQDSTLFLLFRERTPDIWFQKLDWVAKHGGMVLIDTHPDYMSMEGNRTSWEYPARFYEDLLRYVRDRYAGAFWHALPHEVAEFVRTRSGQITPNIRISPRIERRRTQKPKIWIDMDNTPHVPFFEPILDELRSRGFPLLVTARDAFQVYALADKKKLNYLKIGRHNGKNRALKAAGLLYRSLQLAPVVLREKPALGVSHGARSQFIVSNLLRIPSLLIEDYEHCQFPPLMRPEWVLAPEVIPNEALPLKNGRIRKYPGIKEDVYAWKLEPDPAVLEQLGLDDSDLIATVRPPATEAHYHNPEGELLFERFMDLAVRKPGIRIILLPRNNKQADVIRHRWPAWFENGKTVIPGTALDGLNLIWYSDLIVSGGGTMNREAAALKVPVYSIFRGAIGAVDRRLCAEGRLVLIESVLDVERKIHFVKRKRGLITEITSKQTLRSVVDTIEEISELSICASGR
jgi:predicted glycosyltransferase